MFGSNWNYHHITSHAEFSAYGRPHCILDAFVNCHFLFYFVFVMLTSIRTKAFNMQGWPFFYMIFLRGNLQLLLLQINEKLWRHCWRKKVRYNKASFQYMFYYLNLNSEYYTYVILDLCTLFISVNNIFILKSPKMWVVAWK